MFLLLLGWSMAAALAQVPAAAPTTNSPPAVVYDAEAMNYGLEQVNQFVSDRPQMAALIHDDNAIENWAVKAFASPDLDFRLVWDNRPTISGPDDSSESSDFPDGMNRSYIAIDGIWKGGPRAGVKRTAEEMLVNLVFEVANARNGRVHAALDQRALRGEIDREAFIVQSAHNEFDAWRTVDDFHEKIWLPYCRETGTADSPALWRLNAFANFDEWLKKYPRTYWYPWQFYGTRYDKLEAFHYKDTVAAAEKGDAAAQAKMGTMLGYVGLFAQSEAWFLKAANQGSVTGENAMQWFCYNGVETPKDDAQAFTWAMKAAQQGDVTAEKTVAWHYQWGVGVPVDAAAAKTWSDKVAASVAK